MPSLGRNDAAGYHRQLVLRQGMPERAWLDLVVVRRPQRLSQAHRAPGIYDLSMTGIEPQNVSELAEGPATPDKQSYSQILKSSALIGFSMV